MARPRRAAAERVWLRRAAYAALVVLAVAWLALEPRLDDPSVDPSELGRIEATDGDLSFDVGGRGVEVTGTVSGLSSVSLQGPSRFQISGEVIDGPDGASTIEVESDDLTITGTDLRVGGALRFDGRTVRLVSTPSIEVPQGSTIEVEGSGLAPRTVRVTGIVSFLRTNEPVAWVDAPDEVVVRSDGLGRVSWAGDGEVEVGGEVLEAEFGMVRVAPVTASVVRSGDGVRATGTGRAVQVYLDGLPQLRTRATVDLVDVRETVEAGSSAEFTWAPRNVGIHEMAMTRLRPGTGSAAWLSFGLAPLPRTFGGEERPERGGVTDGFRGGQAIRSTLPPGDADRRDITLRVPEGTSPGLYEAQVVVEGNFEPVTVSFEIEVT